jgi:hypothetical protein
MWGYDVRGLTWRCPLSAAARDLLTAFDALSPEEQHQVAAEILRRTSAPDDLHDAAFDELAAELFRAYDAEEAIGGEP